MQLTAKQVTHVATLARIGLSKEEIEKFRTQLSGILDYVEMLSEVDTTGIEPTAQVTGLTNVTREDAPYTHPLALPHDLLKCSPLPTPGDHLEVKSVF